MTLELAVIYFVLMMVLLGVAGIVWWRLGVQEERERREEAAKGAK